MLPLGLLKAASNGPTLVELKSGATLNGNLVACDTWMNITLKDVVLTNKEGTEFKKLPECYVKGSFIKYLQVPDILLDQIKENQQQHRMENNRNRFQNNNNNRNQWGSGGRGNRGRNYNDRNNNNNYRNNNNRGNNYNKAPQSAPTGPTNATRF
ncbi:uncharacterized protein SAPINGB_P004176 [Magnusiomyces paraingens]|uniref:LSM complex subunit LSM4 n=1 Tax=Magnusiomyces paraingens TaxID=2606893 RepID=A0A5E8BSD5_9ASCO|nr:uncharacterized protein SAPINGB_P004176 [Saprochaete ingens]VVT54638.1 unnamed protein product [Saprochaete ingens]